MFKALTIARPREILTIGVLAAALAGCSRASDEKAANRNWFEYEIWSGKVGRELKPNQVTIFQEAETEIRLKIMAQGSASGTDAMNTAYLEAIDGLNAWQLMELGLNDRLERLQHDHADAEDKYTYNAKLRTREGDTASAEYLGARVEEDRKRLEKTSSELHETESELNAIRARQ